MPKPPVFPGFVRGVAPLHLMTAKRIGPVAWWQANNNQGGDMVDSEYTREVLKRCFGSPVAKVNIKTGEGFSRMEDLWVREGFTESAGDSAKDVREEMPHASGL